MLACQLRTASRGLFCAASRSMTTTLDGVKLYDAQAPNCRRVRMFLAEKGVSCEVVQVDIGKAENRTPEFIAKTGTDQVPILELPGGVFISESQAICRYVEAAVPLPAVMGGSPLEVASAEMWARKVEFGLMATVLGTFKHTSPFFAGKVDQCPEFGAFNQARIEAELANLDGVLADGRAFIGGEALGPADISAICTLDFARVLKVKVDAGVTPHLAKWFDAMKARSSYKA
jgi:glutathione S-transferase